MAASGFMEFEKVMKVESHSLRQQVFTAEKVRYPLPRNTRNMPVFRNSSATNRDLEIRNCSAAKAVTAALFSEGSVGSPVSTTPPGRSEEHTSELQSLRH